MAICNLFNKFNKKTGNFLLFSQYTEDLSKCSTHPGVYRVTPSKFIVLNIDYAKFYVENISDDNIKTDDMNINIPTYFQNYFENACATLREELGENWNPSISKNVFWNCMYNGNLLNVDVTPGNPINYAKEIMYIGDINIQTYDEYMGTGYSEIYCHIPGDSKAMYVPFDVFEFTDYTQYIDNVVKGYKADEYKSNSNMCELEIKSNPKYYYNEACIIQTDLNELKSSQAYRDLTEYKFNTIIPLYDIYIIDSQGKYIPQYLDIPMGMYVCGLIEGSTTTNEGIKIVSNDDIYGMGTSYGLRICSRFVTTPNSDNIKNVEISVNNDNSYAATCMVLSKMSESLSKMDEIVETCAQNSQISKDLLAIFKNSRTNVPYIKTIGERSYWFVNGRNTYIPALGKDCDISAYENADVQSGIDEFEKELGYNK